MFSGITVVLLWLPPAASAWPNDPGRVSVTQPGGLSEETQRSISTVSDALGVPTTLMDSGTVRMTAVERGATTVQSFEPGFAVPMSFTAVDVGSASSLLGEDLAWFLENGVVMSQGSAELRGAAVGDTVTLEGWDGTVRVLPITAILPDADVNWSELMLSSTAADGLGIDHPTTAIVTGVNTTVLELLLRTVLPGVPLRISGPGSGAPAVDAVLPSVEVKRLFGEFSFRRTPTDRVETDNAWYDRNIVTVTLPHLGRFRCHRAVVPALVGALGELEARGLIDQIDTADFQSAGGCYNARLARGGDLDRGLALSRHSWGVAIDLNPSANRFGDVPALSAEFGQVMRDWGFAWGAGWTVPDPMHFEWTGPPVGESRLSCLEQVALGLATVPRVRCVP